MKIIIDTNRVIAALIRDSSCRSIILNDKYEFISPDFSSTEIEKYKGLLLEKSGLSEKSLKVVMNLLLEKIDIIPRIEYKDKMSEASKLISDKKDVPFVALALSKKADEIWSDDKHFQEQKKIKIYSTKDLIEI